MKLRAASQAMGLVPKDKPASISKSNTTSGAISYSPYGHRSSRAEILMGLNGEILDNITNCYILGRGYRHFSPIIMRFTSPDSWSPFGLGGLNTYAYCGGDPANFGDSNGHHRYIKNHAHQSRLNSMYAKSPTAKSWLDMFAASLATNHGGAAIPSPIKGRYRAAQKIGSAYNGDISKLEDIVRSTVIVDSDQFQAVYDTLLGAGAKLKYHDKESGYTGLHASLLTPSGLSVELQVHTPESAYANLPEPVVRKALMGKYDDIDRWVKMHGYAGDQAHKYYENFRIESEPLKKQQAIRDSQNYYRFIRDGYMRM